MTPINIPEKMRRFRFPDNPRTRRKWEQRKAAEALAIISQGEIEESELSEKMGLSANTLNSVLRHLRNNKVDTVTAGVIKSYCLWTPRAVFDIPVYPEYKRAR